MSKKYVILNAALDNETWTDWALKLMYRSANFFCATKYKSAKIIDICHQPTFETLSPEDIQAIREADKILITGHCYQDTNLHDTYDKSRVSPHYLAELLANVFNHQKNIPGQISIVACESLKFAERLVHCFNFYPNLIHFTVSARKFDITVDIWSGIKLNNMDYKNKMYHHSQIRSVYKSRFFIDHHDGSIIQQEIAGTWAPTRHDLN